MSFAPALKEYDAENEVYLIRDDRFGDMLVPVPIAKAQDFKARWSAVTVTPRFFIDNDQLALAELAFNVPGGESYHYNNRASLNYASAKIDYNFAPIEIDAPGGAAGKGNQTISTTSVTAGRSDVDVNIPAAGTVNDRTFAVIVANENYQREAKVDFAINDGRTFAEYCTKTLGMPAKNVHYIADATLNNLRAEIGWLCKVAEAYRGEADIIFYYAGHGLPPPHRRIRIRRGHGLRRGRPLREARSDWRAVGDRLPRRMLQRLTARRGHAGLGAGRRAEGVGGSSAGQHGGFLGGAGIRNGLPVPREGTRNVHLLPAAQTAGYGRRCDAQGVGRLHLDKRPAAVDSCQRQEPDPGGNTCSRIRRKMARQKTEVDG